MNENKTLKNAQSQPLIIVDVSSWFLELKNCIDCQNHKVLADPDPDDWFVMMT